MARACFSWLDEWLAPAAIRRRGMTSPWCFAPHPGAVAGVIAKLDRPADRVESGPPRATINSRVKVLEMESGEETAFTLVMPHEADPEEKKISVLSPLGSSLLARRAGSVVSVALLGRASRFCILDVENASESGEVTEMEP